MSGNLLLDTNAIIAIFANDPRIGPIISESVCSVPSIVIGELLYGVERSRNRSENLLRIYDFCDKIQVLACDRNTASVYATLKNLLRSAGTPIPENDLWIAAVTKQSGMRLLSQDTHFDCVPGISRLGW